MANFKVNNVPSWVQYTATNGQTQFSIPFPFINDSDLSVWQNDVLLVLTTDYTLDGAQTSSGGQLTLNVGASLNDKITIQDLMVIDRTSIYTPTISALTGSQLNEDFNRDVIMIRDTTTTVNYLMLQYEPFDDISQDITDTTDRIIPILPPLSTWQKNADNTAIIAVSLPTSVVGVDGSFTNNNRITTTNTVPGDNYIQQTDVQIVDDTITSISGNLILTGTNNVSLVTPGNVILSPSGNLVLDGVTWPTTGGLAGQSPYLINSTLLGWQYNAGSSAIQDNSFIYADDTGTANTYEIALTPPITSYVEGQTFYFKAANANTGASTLNVNGLGAIDMNKNYNAALANADIVAGQIVQVTYDGSTFQLDSPVANIIDGGGVNPGNISQAAFYASDGNVVSGTYALTINAVSSGVNNILVTNGATTVAPSITAYGSDSTIDLVMSTKGNGIFYFFSTFDIGMSILPVASAANYFQILSAITGGVPAINAEGSDTNINMLLNAKGTGAVYLGAGGVKTFVAATPVSSQVNYIVANGSATGNPASIIAEGDTNLVLELKGSGTGGAAVQGSSAGVLPSAGYVGQVISNAVLAASAVSLSTTTAADVTTINVSAGNWEISGIVSVMGSGANILGMFCWASLTSATRPDTSIQAGINGQATGTIGFAIAPLTVSVSSTTTVYLSVWSNFTSTAGASGYIIARRLP